MFESSPEHWQQHTGPSDWFGVAYPPSWKATESDGNFQLSPLSGSGTLTFHCFWVKSAQSVDLESAVQLERLFPQRRNVRTIDALPIADESIAYEGEAILGKRTAWWRRFFDQRTWRRWRIWAVNRNSVCLIAAYVQTGEHDPETETIVRMILNTIELADPPADPPSVFATRVLDLAREKFPLLECRQCDEFQLTLGESTINLFNFYRSYVNCPERFQEIVLPALTTMVQVQEWGDAQTEPPLDDVRDRIMPMLYPESVWRESFPNFVARPWIANLMVLYVVDESQAYWYIRNDLLERWQLTQDELHALAIKNLGDYFEEHGMELMLTGEESGARMLLPSRPDAYNTSRLLSESFHKSMQEVLGREFAAGIPNRDFFVAVSLDSETTVEHIRQKIAEDYARMDHPLSDRLLLVSSDGVSEYCNDTR